MGEAAASMIAESAGGGAGSTMTPATAIPVPACHGVDRRRGDGPGNRRTAIVEMGGTPIRLGTFATTVTCATATAT